MRRYLWALLISSLCFATPVAAKAAGAMGPNGLTNECTHQVQQVLNVKTDEEARRLPVGYTVSYLGHNYKLGKTPPTTLWGVCKILVKSGDFTQANVAGTSASASPTAPAPAVIAPPVAPKPQATLQPPMVAEQPQAVLQPQAAPQAVPELTVISPAVTEVAAQPIEQPVVENNSPTVYPPVYWYDRAWFATRDFFQGVWSWSTGSWWQITLSVVGAIVLLLTIAYGLAALYFRLQPEEDESETEQNAADLMADRYVDPADAEEDLADHEPDSPVFAGYDNRTPYERHHDPLDTDDLPAMHAADLGDIRPPPQSGQRHH